MEFLKNIPSHIFPHFSSCKKRKRGEFPEENFNRSKRPKYTSPPLPYKEEEKYQPSILQRTVTPCPIPLRSSVNTPSIQDPLALYKAFISPEDETSKSAIKLKLSILTRASEYAEHNLKLYESEYEEDDDRFHQAVDTISKLQLMTESHDDLLTSDLRYSTPEGLPTTESKAPFLLLQSKEEKLHDLTQISNIETSDFTYSIPEVSQETEEIIPFFVLPAKEKTLHDLTESFEIKTYDIAADTQTKDLSRYEKALDEICNIELYTESLPPEILPSKYTNLKSEKEAYLDEILAYQQKYNISKLTKQQLLDIDNLMDQCDYNDLIVKIANTPIHGRDFKRLAPKSWLNDEIMNGYLELIQTSKDVILFNTFFYEILKNMYQAQQIDANRIKRILRRKGVSSLTESRMSVIPVNIKDYHWALVVIDNSLKTVSYYDSLNDILSEEIFDTLSYILDSDLKEVDYQCFVPDSPKQENGSDCGLFVLRTIECVIMSEDVKFSQEDMNYYRYLIGWRLLNKTID